MSTFVDCHCGQQVIVRRTAPGQRLVCPKCGAELSLPRSAAARDVFISYAFEDLQVAEAIYAGLNKRKLTCFMAPRDITPGANFAEALIDAIENAAAVVLILTRSSNESQPVLSEISTAYNARRPIITFRVHNIEVSKNLAFYIGTSHWQSGSDPVTPAHLDAIAHAVRALGAVPTAARGTVGAVAADMRSQPSVSQFGGDAYVSLPPHQGRRWLPWALGAGGATAIMLVAVLLMLQGSGKSATTAVPEVSTRFIAPEDAAITSAQAALNLGLGYAARGDITRALSCANRAVQLEPGFDIYRFRASCFLTLGNVEAARADALLVLQHAPDEKTKQLVMQELIVKGIVSKP